MRWKTEIGDEINDQKSRIEGSGLGLNIDVEAQNC